jgi:hypothetical protein
MTDVTYIFTPLSYTTSVDWSNPSIWAGGIVPNASNAAVEILASTLAPNGPAYYSTITVSNGESYSVDSLSLASNELAIQGSLSVAGMLTIQQDAVQPTALGVSGTLSAGSIINDGQVNGGGLIQVSGSTTNNSIIGGAGLSLTTGALSNSGTLAAILGDFTVNVTPGGFSNLSASTLTGGTYTADSGTLYLNVGGVIVTDAADIALKVYSTPGVIESFNPMTGQYVQLQSTLQTIAQSGTLSLSGVNYNWGPLQVNGQLDLSNTIFTSSQLVVGVGGQIAGSATTIASPVQNSGVIEAGGSQSAYLNIASSVTGPGSLVIGAGTFGSAEHFPFIPYPDTLELSAPETENVTFSNNIGILTLDNPSGFTGSITPSTSGPSQSPGDQIVLDGLSLSNLQSYSYAANAAGGVLILHEASGTFTQNFQGNFNANSFQFAAGQQSQTTGLPSLQITVSDLPPVTTLSNTQLVAELYIGYFDRAPDPTGLIFWLNSLSQGVSLATVANDFANAIESTTVYPFLLNPTAAGYSAFITSVYENILNRTTDAAGAAFWLNQLQTGDTTPGGFILAIEDSVNMQSGTADALTLENKTAVAVDYYTRISAADVPFNGVYAVLDNVTSNSASVLTAEAVTTAIIACGTAATIDFEINLPVEQSATFNAVSQPNYINHLIVVNPDIAQLTATGYDSVYIVASGGPAIIEYPPLTSFKPSSFAANPGGAETLNLTGTSAIITDALNLSGTTTTINDTDTNFVTIFSASAEVINAASSGGLVMLGPDTNYAGTVGDAITGSSIAANVLIGSPANDLITASNVGGDKISTDGGADIVNLNVHSQSDTIYFVAYSLTTVGITGFQYIPFGQIVDGNDETQSGFWGLPPAGSGSAGPPTSSTSVDQSVMTGFNSGPASNADVLQFSISTWTTGSIDAGLTSGDGHTVVSGATLIDLATTGATLSTTANVIEITDSTFSNAASLATALSTTYGLTFGGTGVSAGKDAHMLFLYNDASGNAHIADVDFENSANASAATTTTAVSHIVASDMVELAGVSMTSLAGNNVHLV